MPEAIMNAVRSTCCVLMAIIFLSAGCGTTKPAPNPLESWKRSWSQDPNDLSKTIRDDYQDYIQHLPPEERKFVGSINLYEDGSGRHVVNIEINLNGTRWEHLLIYDRSNKRTTSTKSVGGHYRS